VKKKIGERETRKNEQKVWAKYPEATYFGVDDKKNFPNPAFCVCQVYESGDLNAKVIGDGDSYNEAWADAASKL
jgi:hypothetical protein